MHKRTSVNPRLITIVFCLIAWLGITGRIAEAKEVTWPLDLSTRYLTSNFMEYRAGRFHAGLDLKTMSRCGYACVAVEAGYISRIKTSAGGYGRALYLQGESGRTFVYAHLGRLADPARAVLRQAQRKQGRWSVDIEPGSGVLPVKCGDVLALSGQSATHGPHLHFEVRDARQRPLNPLAEGFAVADTFPPIIRSLRAFPAAEGATVAGGVHSRILEAVPGLDGRLPDLTVSGAVAFSAVVLDHADIRAYRLEPWRITFSIDDREIGKWVNDRFAFEKQSSMRLEWIETAGTRERRLQLIPPNTLYGRSGESLGAGVCAFAPGDHQARLLVEDMAGNSRLVSWRLRVLEADAPAETEGCDWRPDTMGVPLAPGASGKARWLTPTLVLVQDDAGGFVARDAAKYAKSDREGGGRVLPVSKKNNLLKAGVYWILKSDLSGQESRAALQAQGLRDLGCSAEYRAARWLTKRATPVALPDCPIDSLPETAAVYRLDDDGLWAFVSPAERAPDGRLSFAMEEPGRHALMCDESPPWLEVGAQAVPVLRSPIGEKHGITLPRYVPLGIGIQDLGSGVNPDSCLAWLDALPLLVEADLPRDRLLLELPDELRIGRHKLELSVCDRAGNRSGKTLILELKAGD